MTETIDELLRDCETAQAPDEGVLARADVRDAIHATLEDVDALFERLIS